MAFAFGLIAECYFSEGNISKKFEFGLGLILGERDQKEVRENNVKNYQNEEMTEK